MGMMHPRINRSLQVVRLDKRWAGYRQFRYCINFVEHYMSSRNDRLRLFNDIRSWCTDTWGVSCERDIYIILAEDLSKAKHDDSLNGHWAWHSDLNTGTFRFYLKTDKEVEFFMLRWSGNEQI